MSSIMPHLFPGLGFTAILMSQFLRRSHMLHPKWGQFKKIREAITSWSQVKSMCVVKQVLLGCAWCFPVVDNGLHTVRPEEAGEAETTSHIWACTECFVYLVFKASKTRLKPSPSCWFWWLHPLHSLRDWSCRDASAVKSAGCSCRWSGFITQHQHENEHTDLWIQILHSMWFQGVLIPAWFVF